MRINKYWSCYKYTSNLIHIQTEIQSQLAVLAVAGTLLLALPITFNSQPIAVQLLNYYFNFSFYWITISIFHFRDNQASWDMSFSLTLNIFHHHPVAQCTPKDSSPAAILELATSHLEHRCSRQSTEIEQEFPDCKRDPETNLTQKKVLDID